MPPERSCAKKDRKLSGRAPSVSCSFCVLDPPKEQPTGDFVNVLSNLNLIVGFSFACSNELLLKQSQSVIRRWRWCEQLQAFLLT